MLVVLVVIMLQLVLACWCLGMIIDKLDEIKEKL